MSIPPGTRLGPYEILCLLGAGGMGEVYKAKDPKLDRLVAIKVLPAALASHPDALARFEREARAVAALSHPNVLGIFDLGSQDGVTYAVMELLVGEDLHDRLKGGALPAKRAIEIATEVALGLGAAHERGIVHRDVKPENIFLTEDGRVRVLDFGLARLVAPSTGDEQTEVMAPGGTEIGMVLGTTGYMSPEQVKGEPVDHRSDVFAFGVVLYEMLSGRRPFRGETPHHTMTAILDQDPPPLVGTRGPVPPALERLLAHCLEKAPRARFQSMADIAYDLQNLSTAGSAPVARPVPGRRRRPQLLAALAGVAGTVLALLLAGAFHLPPFTPPVPPTFTRVTYTLGTIDAAFFGPDGRTVYYSQRLQGGPPELFVLHPGSREPRAMGVMDALLLGVSPHGDLAILRHPEVYYSVNSRGTLAQVGAEGGAVKETRANVTQAAWDGSGFATVTDHEEVKEVLEFGGRVLGEFQPGLEELKFLRRSPDGRDLALVLSGSGRTEILSYDREGRRTVHFTKPDDARGDTLTGLAWGPEGDLWCSELQGAQTLIWSLPRHGARRAVWQGEGRKALLDVSREGRLLLADQQLRRGVQVQKAGETVARDISIANGTQALGFSADGGALLLLESPVLGGGTPQDQTYLWSGEPGASVRIASGAGATLSPDGRWINLAPSAPDAGELDPALGAAFRAVGLEPRAVLDREHPASCLLFVPTGAGQPFALALPKELSDAGYGYLLPDGKRILFQGNKDHLETWFTCDRQGREVKAVTGPGWGGVYVGLAPLSPDGSRMVVGHDQRFAIQLLSGGEPQPIRGLVPGERVLGWSRDQQAVFIRDRSLAVAVFRLELATGARRPVFTYQPGDASGLLNIRGIYTTPDARIFALNINRMLSDLYVVDGLK